MKSVSILVLESAVLEAVADPRYLFTMVNQFLQSSGKRPLFQVQMVGTSREVWYNDGLFSVRTDQLLGEVEKTDLVIIPALFGDVGTALYKNETAVPWIMRQYERGAEVASLCLGAFLLASTGLLDGKRCSTHWAFADQFREMFPTVKLVDGSILTEEQRLYSSGGANSYWNLLLYLVEKYTDRDTAILAAKYFAIDIDRDSQSAFMLFKGQKGHGDAEVLLAQEFIEENYGGIIRVDELADRVAVGRRTFERRFRKATHHSVVDYIQRVKVEAAKRSFESSRRNITEVMFDVGYTDAKAFREVFKRIAGLTPIEYRNKYFKDSAVQV